MKNIIGDYFKRRALWKLAEYYDKQAKLNGELSTYTDDRDLKIYCIKIKIKLDFDNKKQEVLNQIQHL